MPAAHTRTLRLSFSLSSAFSPGHGLRRIIDDRKHSICSSWPGHHTRKRYSLRSVPTEEHCKRQNKTRDTVRVPEPRPFRRGTHERASAGSSQRQAPASQGRREHTHTPIASRNRRTKAARPAREMVKIAAVALLAGAVAGAPAPQDAPAVPPKVDPVPAPPNIMGWLGVMGGTIGVVSWIHGLIEADYKKYRVGSTMRIGAGSGITKEQNMAGRAPQM